MTLNCLGYNRHYPHAATFAPTTLFGCGLLDLRLEQGLSHLQALLDYVGTDHKVGRVMIISLRTLQIEAGVSFDLLRHPHIHVPHVSECWIIQLRRFCADWNVASQVKANRLPTGCREYDHFLMDRALTLRFTKRELTDVNLVRIYLGVTTLSDIASAIGSHIHRLIWHMQPLEDRKSWFQFARQEQPTVYQKGLWRCLLKRFLLDGRVATDRLRLHQPLGHWLSPSTMQWGAMVWDGALYRHDPFKTTGNRYVAVHFPHPLASTMYYDQKPDWYSATLPRLAIPADIAGDQIFLATYAAWQVSEIAPAITSFSACLNQLPPAEKRLVSSVFFAVSDAETVLVQYLKLACTVYIGTDGGKKDMCGSFSWVICSPGHEQLVLNAGPVDGWHKCHSSRQSEVAALASVTLYLKEIAAYFSLHIRCRFLFFVDSHGAISNAQQIRYFIPRRSFMYHADILWTLKEAPHVVKHYHFEHVKSHQDDKIAVEDLPFSAQLNVLCDGMATEQMKRQTFHVTEASSSTALPSRSLPLEIFLTTHFLSLHQKLTVQN